MPHSEDMSLERKNRAIYTHGHPENRSVDAQWHNNRSQHHGQTGGVVDNLLGDLLPGRGGEIWGCCFNKDRDKEDRGCKGEREQLVLGSGFRTRVPNVWLKITNV